MGTTQSHAPEAPSQPTDPSSFFTTKSAHPEDIPRTTYILTMDLSRTLELLTIQSPKAQNIPKWIDQYRRFLILKIHQRDLLASILSPSPLIDRVWNCHILDTCSYAAMCDAIGMIIHHDPLAGKDPEARMKRRKSTLAVYEQYFGEKPPADIWGIEGPKHIDKPKDPSQKGGKHGRPPKSVRMALAAARSDLPAEFPIHIQRLTRKTVTLRVKPTDTVEAVKKLLQDEEGVPPGELKLLFGGKHLEDARTLGHYGIRDESVINLVSSV